MARASERNRWRRETIATSQALPWNGRRVLPCPFCLKWYSVDQISDTDAYGKPILSIEDAPQRSHRRAEPELRCLTCAVCNNRFDFEREVSQRHRQRQELIEKHSALPPQLRDRWSQQNFRRISELAVISDAERRFEVKNAYVLAYVTLGAKWLLNSKLDEIRRLLQNDDPLPDACATFSEAVTQRQVHIVSGQVDCVAVAIPPHHGHNADSAGLHCVLLPHGRSPTPFYNAWMKRDQSVGLNIDASFDFPDPLKLSNVYDECTSEDCLAHPHEGSLHTPLFS